MAKIQASKALQLAANHAIQILGSYGLQEDRRYTQILADAAGGCIAGGTEEVHRRVIFNKMMREHASQRAAKYTLQKKEPAPRTPKKTLPKPGPVDVFTPL